MNAEKYVPNDLKKLLLNNKIATLDELKAVLNEFDKLDPKEYKSWPEPDKIAFWINVYNLQKLSVVTDNYPITPASRFHILYYWSPSSIRHIEAQITKHKFLVMDEEFTFSEIEKRFFRREFDDPRIFFATTDACLSSPPLRNEAFVGINGNNGGHGAPGAFHNDLFSSVMHGPHQVCKLVSGLTCADMSGHGNYLLLTGFD